ncbi:MAG: DNA-processing protein DprA [Pseudomonadota bacterium]
MDKSGVSSSHPPLPPISEEDLFLCLRLLRSRRVGVATYNRLICEHGSAREALEALPEIARAAGVQGYDVCPEGVIVAELKAARRAKARLIAQGHEGYPHALADIEDAPPLLWARGPLDPNDKTQIALVGARNASSLGTRMTRKLAAEIGAAGFLITSGLARGVDSVAHQTALDTGAGTVAVLASGVDVCYPAENAALMGRIAEHGLILSEAPMGRSPQARHFPARNRIIAGLSRAVVVIEAASKSGTLITAEMALDQGRDVLAVPGHPFDARAAGCLHLIRDGATLVRSAADVLEALTPTRAPPRAPQRPAAPAPAPAPKRTLREVARLHQQILDQLGPSPLAEDQLIRDTGASAEQVSSVLVDLEIDGRIERQAGGFLAIKAS